MKKFLLFIVPVLFMFGCEKESQTALQILSNSKVENDNSVWFTFSDTTVFHLERTDEDSHSPDHSLLISRDNLNSDLGEFGCWSQNIAKNIPIGKELALKVWIKGVNVTGNGVSLVVRADDQYTTLQFAATQYVTTIAGTFDWTEYTLDFPAVDPETTSIWVFLILLNGTTGKVYIDDITLSEKAAL